MARIRISTTVSEERLARARNLAEWDSDAAMLDEALDALFQRYRSAQIDSAYRETYGTHPVSDQDEWGDLGSFRAAAARS